MNHPDWSGKEKGRQVRRFFFVSAATGLPTMEASILTGGLWRGSHGFLQKLYMRQT